MPVAVAGAKAEVAAVAATVVTTMAAAVVVAEAVVTAAATTTTTIVNWFACAVFVPCIQRQRQRHQQ